MNDYQNFAKNLFSLLGKDKNIRILSIGFLPLIIETFGHDYKDRPIIVMSHQTVNEEGHTLRTPEIAFLIEEGPNGPEAEPATYRDDVTQTYRETYENDDNGKPTTFNQDIQKEITAYTRTWFANLHQQGFFHEDAIRTKALGPLL